MRRTPDCDVFVVGLGEKGSMLASALAQLGWTVMRVDRPEEEGASLPMGSEYLRQALQEASRSPSALMAMGEATGESLSTVWLAARIDQAAAYVPAAIPAPSARHRLDASRLQRVLDYVETHIADDLCVADLARIACLSIFHFTRAFAAAVGVPPHRFITQQRLEHAKQLLVAGRWSLSEIAFHCQFSSQSSFSRAFRKATGLTPATYRRQQSTSWR